MAKELDPKKVDARLYDAISKLLDNFDEMSVREQVAAVSAIARIRAIFYKLRGDQDDDSRGSAVKRYEATFKENAANSRRTASGHTISVVSDGDDDLLSDDEDSEL